MRLLLLSILSATLLVACGKGSPVGRAGPAGAASAAAADAVLLLAPEDLRSAESRLLASGPVVSGSLQPGRRADLRAEVGALVQQVLRENGEPVRTGDLLVRLDDSALRESLASAEASVRAATQAFDQAERQVARLKALQAQGMVSVQAFEDAEVRRNAAQSELVAARARVSSAQQQLRRTEVRAPFDGVLSDRKVSVGDTAQVGKELVKVFDPGSLRLEGLVSADRMHELKTGQTVSFQVNGYPGVEFSGRLRRVDATANAATRQVEVVVEFSDPAAAPRVAGLFAEGRVLTGGSQALMLPEAPLVRAGELVSVWRLEGAAVHKRQVTLGPRDVRSGEFPVLSGLAAGDRVLRNPGSALVDGQRVEMAAAAASAPAASR